MLKIFPINLQEKANTCFAYWASKPFVSDDLSRISFFMRIEGRSWVKSGTLT